MVFAAQRTVTSSPWLRRLSDRCAHHRRNSSCGIAIASCDGMKSIALIVATITLLGGVARTDPATESAETMRAGGALFTIVGAGLVTATTAVGVSSLFEFPPSSQTWSTLIGLGSSAFVTFGIGLPLLFVGHHRLRRHPARNLTNPQ
jgi:hypothetical protein